VRGSAGRRPSCFDRRLQVAGLARGDVDPQPAVGGRQPCRRAGAALQRLVAEAQDRAGQVLGPVEDVHLAAPDHAHAARAHRQRLAVDQVQAGAGAHPDQLVVVVPVRLAGLAGADRQPLQADHRDCAVGVQAIE